MFLPSARLVPDVCDAPCIRRPVRSQRLADPGSTITCSSRPSGRRTLIPAIGSAYAISEPSGDQTGRPALLDTIRAPPPPAWTTTTPTPLAKTKCLPSGDQSMNWPDGYATVTGDSRSTRRTRDHGHTGMRSASRRATADSEVAHVDDSSRRVPIDIDNVPARHSAVQVVDEHEPVRARPGRNGAALVPDTARPMTSAAAMAVRCARLTERGCALSQLLASVRPRSDRAAEYRKTRPGSRPRRPGS